VGADLAAVGVDDRAGDREADAAAAAAAAGRGVGAGTVDAEEAFEHSLEQVQGDALAGVGDRDLHLACGRRGGGDLDVAAGWGVAQGVGEQVGEHLADAVGVDGDLGQVPVGAGGQGDALGGVGGVGGLDGLDGGADQRIGLPCGQVQVELAFLGAGDGVEVVEQPTQPGRLGLEHLPGLLVGGHDLVGDALQVAVDGGQRVAQLVG